MPKKLHDISIAFGLIVRYETDTEGDDSPQCFPCSLFELGRIDKINSEIVHAWRIADSNPMELRDLAGLFSVIKATFREELAETRKSTSRKVKEK